MEGGKKVLLGRVDAEWRDVLSEVEVALCLEVTELEEAVGELRGAHRARVGPTVELVELLIRDALQTGF